MSPIIDLQKRARELGRIRLGIRETFTKRDGSEGTRPAKLDRFRLTSASKPLLEKVAELYGGTVQQWQPPTGAAQWEVITDRTRLPIMVPPQPISQWHEVWRASGCVHRCDGHTNVLTDEPCDPDDPVHQEALKKPTTRLNVVLRDVEGIGVWRVETHGWFAAIEIPDAAEFLAYAGGYVNGWLALEQRTSIDNTGEKPVTRHFMVPIIEIDVTPSQLMAGRGRVAAPALAGGPVGETPALAAAGPDYVALAADLETADEIRALYKQAWHAGHMTQGLADHMAKRVADIEAATQTGAPGGASGEEVGASTPPASSTPSPDGDVVDGEVVEDAEAVWARIVAAAADRGLGKLPDLQDDVETFLGGTSAGEASGEELAEYLEDLLKREVTAA